MRRVISILLILAFCFSLSGCRLIKRECELCHDAVGEYREDAGLYDYLCYDCYYDVVVESDDLFTDGDLDLDDYLDEYDYDDYDYYNSDNYCDDCGDEIPSNRNYCDDCLEDFLDSLDDY